MVIKFLAFYFTLCVFVNMILHDLRGIGGIFRPGAPRLGIYRFTGLQPPCRIMQAAKQDISSATFLRRSVFLAFVNEHGYNLAL